MLHNFGASVYILQKINSNKRTNFHNKCIATNYYFVLGTVVYEVLILL